MFEAAPQKRGRKNLKQARDSQAKKSGNLYFTRQSVIKYGQPLLEVISTENCDP